MAAAESIRVHIPLIRSFQESFQCFDVAQQKSSGRKSL